MSILSKQLSFILKTIKVNLRFEYYKLPPLFVAFLFILHLLMLENKQYIVVISNLPSLFPKPNTALFSIISCVVIGKYVTYKLHLYIL